MTERYVAGFAIRGDDNVLLVRKNKPSWQHGLLNGIGGKVEGDEGYNAAMRREFREETGLDVLNWLPFAREHGPGYIVMFYRTALMPNMLPARPVNDVGETLEWHSLRFVDDDEVVGNLQWLLPLARDTRDMMTVATTTSSIAEKPTW